MLSRFTLDNFSIKLLNLQQSKNTICNNHKYNLQQSQNTICNNHKIQFATITNAICNNHKYNLQQSQIQFATITKYKGFIPITQLTCIAFFRLRRGILTYVIILCLINMFLYN
jgi:hypothetical protein